MIRRILLVVALLGSVTVFNVHSAGAGTCPARQLSVNDVTVGEGDGHATFTISLDTAAAETCPVIVNFATADGSAKAASDYTATSGEATIDVGQTSTTVNVSVTDDEDAEDDETFTLNLSNPTNGTIADGEGVATITDNDEAPTTTTAAPTTTTAAPTTTTAPPTSTISNDNPDPGDDVTITGSGFGPDTGGTIFVLSEPIQLATATADSEGVIRATVTIPEEIQPGAHTIEIRGVDANDTPRTVSIPITVAGEVTGTTAAAQPLAATGSGLSTLILVAGVLAAAGGALLLQVRRRRTAATG